jgi:hypothetical protein
VDSIYVFNIAVSSPLSIYSFTIHEPFINIKSHGAIVLLYSYIMSPNVNSYDCISDHPLDPRSTYMVSLLYFCKLFIFLKSYFFSYSSASTLITEINNIIIAYIEYSS